MRHVFLLFALCCLLAAQIVHAAPTHQGRGVDSFIPSGVEDVQEWRNIITSSAELCALYKKHYGVSREELLGVELAMGRIGKTGNYTVYCLDGGIYQTTQRLIAGEYVIGTFSEGYFKPLIIADCGNPLGIYWPPKKVAYVPPPPVVKKPQTKEIVCTVTVTERTKEIIEYGPTPCPPSPPVSFGKSEYRKSDKPAWKQLDKTTVYGGGRWRQRQVVKVCPPPPPKPPDDCGPGDAPDPPGPDDPGVVDPGDPSGPIPDPPPSDPNAPPDQPGHGTGGQPWDPSPDDPTVADPVVSNDAGQPVR